MDLREKEGALSIFDKKTSTIVVLAQTRIAILFWLFICKRFRIRVLTEIN
jgi:hypothetical protein